MAINYGILRGYDISPLVSLHRVSAVVHSSAKIMKIGQVSKDWSFVGKDTTVLFLFSIQLSK